jgi:hypothetical protein
VTILIIKDPNAVQPDNCVFQQRRVLGTANPIAYKDIIKLERDTSPCLRTCAIHWVLTYLMTAPDFCFETYTGNKHPLFDALSNNQLPIGPEHVTCQYMLNTVSTLHSPTCPIGLSLLYWTLL